MGRVRKNPAEAGLILVIAMGLGDDAYGASRVVSNVGVSHDGGAKALDFDAVFVADDEAFHLMFLCVVRFVVLFMPYRCRYVNPFRQEKLVFL